jgi:hypothetical protein
MLDLDLEDAMDSQNETQGFLVKPAQEEWTYKLEEDDFENGAPQTNDAEDSNDKSEEDQQQQQRNPLRRLSNAVTIRRLLIARVSQASALELETRRLEELLKTNLKELGLGLEADAIDSE